MCLYNQNNLNVAKIAAKDSTRPEIAGVYFSKDSTVATDSYRLIEMTVPGNEDVDNFPVVDKTSAMRGVKPFIVDAKAVLKMKVPRNKILPIVSHVAISHADKDKVSFYSTDLETANVQTLRTIQERYPDWKGIVPTEKPVIEIKVNLEMLKGLCEVLSGVNTSAMVTIYGDDKSIKIDVENVTTKQKGMGLLMPIMK